MCRVTNIVTVVDENRRPEVPIGTRLTEVVRRVVRTDVCPPCRPSRRQCLGGLRNAILLGVESPPVTAVGDAVVVMADEQRLTTSTRVRHQWEVSDTHLSYCQGPVDTVGQLSP